MMPCFSQLACGTTRFTHVALSKERTVTLETDCREALSCLLFVFGAALVFVVIVVLSFVSGYSTDIDLRMLV